MVDREAQYRDGLKERFMLHVRKTKTCWFWTGATGSNGYGSFRIGEKVLSSHRVAYQLFRGVIPKGVFVCHICDVKRCIRPTHLLAQTRSWNTKDALVKGFGKLPDNNGERCGAAKLLLRQVKEIRLKYIPNVYSLSRLAHEYHVTKSTIQKVIEGRTWK